MTRSVVVPPYVESPDSHRCNQATIMMIVKHFMPQKEWTFAEVDKLCSYVEGKWSWSEAPAVSLAEMGFDVVCYTDLDVQDFINSPETYFIKRYGEAHGKLTNDNIDMQVSVDICQRYLAKDIQTIKIGWTLGDAISLLEQGYLLMVWVNPRVLYSRTKNDSSHFIVVFDYNKESETIFFHDPGSQDGIRQFNSCKNACFGAAHFMDAVRSGGENGSCLTAFRLQK